MIINTKHHPETYKIRDDTALDDTKQHQQNKIFYINDYRMILNTC